MNVGQLNPALERLAAIDLTELVACAELQTRVDRKYLLPMDALHVVVDQLPSSTRVLEIDGFRSCTYRSLYFDTPDLLSYRLTAHRRRRRFKVRTRVYETSGECWLEVKTRGPRGSTVKHRLPYDPADHDTLAPGRSFVDTVLSEHCALDGRRFTFVQALTTQYRRTTLHLPHHNSRVTIDTELTWDTGAQQLRLPQQAVLETKTGSTASELDRLLWRNRYRPVRMSKYATGLAALNPELPAAAWRRTLRRDFPPTGAARSLAPFSAVPRAGGVPLIGAPRSPLPPLGSRPLRRGGSLGLQGTGSEDEDPVRARSSC